MLSPSNLQNTIRASGTSIAPDNILAVFFNILFQNEQLLLTTGVSYRTFITDKSFEKEWEKFTIQFLKRNRTEQKATHHRVHVCGSGYTKLNNRHD